MIDQPVLDHGTTRSGRWLRRYRTRIAFWIAVVEAILLVFGGINRWGALFVAVLVIVGYFAIGSRLRTPVARDLAWIAAVSQALVALVPIGLFLVLAYNLELLNGSFHSDLWFGLAWGGFPVVCGYAAVAGSLDAAAFLAAGAQAYFAKSDFRGLLAHLCRPLEGAAAPE